MGRKFDKKNNCECGGRYYDSNKWKHEKSKKHIEWSKGTEDKPTIAKSQGYQVICKHCQSVIKNNQDSV